MTAQTAARLSLLGKHKFLLDAIYSNISAEANRGNKKYEYTMDDSDLQEVCGILRGEGYSVLAIPFGERWWNLVIRW